MLSLPPLVGTRILTAWRLDVPAVIVLVLLACGYLYGVSLLRRRGERWALWPTVAFLVLGLGSIVVVTMSCLGVYDRVLFWPRSVQYTVLLAASPLFLAMGEPLELVRRCLSEAGRRRLQTVLQGRVLRVVSFPLLGAVLGVVCLLVIYLTPLFELTLTSETAHHLVWLGLLLAGAVFYLPELDGGGDLLPSWCGYSLRMAFSVVDGLLDAVPGVVIMTMHGTIAAGFYAGVNRQWGPSLHWDQTIGGGLMFTLAEVVALPFLVVLFVRWMHDDERAGHEADLRLDREARVSSPTGADVPLTTRPWWETDPGPLAQRSGIRQRPEQNVHGRDRR